MGPDEVEIHSVFIILVAAVAVAISFCATVGGMGGFIFSC